MGVYIKGMKMPLGCDDCYFCGEMGMCSVLVATHINSGVVGEYRYNAFERPPFCPLIPVPDHGRLIDADELYDTLDGGYDIDFDEVPETKAELLAMIKRQVTIIPASKEDTDEQP